MALTAQQKRVRRKWIAALRSGEYKQGTGMLRRRHKVYSEDRVGHCCLGVLCEVLGVKYREEAGLPSSQVLGAAGIGDLIGDLTEVNDNRGGSVGRAEGRDLPHCNFNEIADTLEYATLAGV